MRDLSLKDLNAICNEVGGVATDMDGVLCNLTKSLIRVTGTKLKYEDFVHEEFCDTLQMSKAELWPMIEKEGPDFWENIEKYPYADNYIKWLLNFNNLLIATSPVDKKVREYAQTGKYKWLVNHGLGQAPILFAKKKSIIAHNFVLIDDLPANVDKFIAAGGIAVMVSRPWNKHITNLPRIVLEDVFA